MKLILNFSIIFVFLSFFGLGSGAWAAVADTKVVQAKQSGAWSVTAVASGTQVVSGAVTATLAAETTKVIGSVNVKNNLTTHLAGRQTTTTSPSLAFTVVAGTYCKMHFSFYGVSSSSAGTVPSMKLSNGANIIQYFPGNLYLAGGGVIVGFSSDEFTLEAGSYTFDTSTAFAATGGNAAYHGFCTTIQ